MNKTERKAKKWLMSLGYSANGIAFQSIESPDFLLSDGSSIEVKRVRTNSHTLTIDEGQWLKLKAQPNCSIAIFTDMVKEPVAMLKVSEIKPPFGGNGYTIKIKDDGMKKWRRHLYILGQLRGKNLSHREFWREYHILNKNHNEEARE